MKTGILDFYCCYLSIKKSSDKTNMGLKIVQNSSTKARHGNLDCQVVSLILATIQKWCILDVLAVPYSPLRDSLYLSVFYVELQTSQLHLVPFQCLIIILNDSRFSGDPILYGKLFQILGPKTFKGTLMQILKCLYMLGSI